MNRTRATAERVASLICSMAASAAFAALTSLALPAVSAAAERAAAASSTPDATQKATLAPATPMQMTPDDPVKVRDALMSQMPADATQSFSKRIRQLAREPFERIFHGQAATTANGQRTFLFMIPAPHGILYRANTRLLTVKVPLATDDDPNAILLYQHIDGSSGRGLVIAPDAKEKGYIQQIDSIALKTEGTQKTVARGRLKLSKNDFEQAGNNFAIVLVCTLQPPYLTDTREHSDPTDDEPTDITRRTSVLHASVQAVWLVNSKDGTVLAKGLTLGK